MLIPKLTSEDVVESYSEVLPMAADLRDEYLSNLDEGIAEQEIPVTKTVDKGSAGLMGQKRLFHIFQPEAKPISKFKMLHFAEPVGLNLSVGWFLLGEGTGFGRTGFRFPILDDVNLLENSDLQAITKSIHAYVVLPVVDDIAIRKDFEPALLRRTSRGIFSP